MTPQRVCAEIKRACRRWAPSLGALSSTLRGMCVVAGLALHEELRRRGIASQLVGGAAIVEVRRVSVPVGHVWVELPDGTILDPTRRQFGRGADVEYHPTMRGVRAVRRRSIEAYPIQRMMVESLPADWWRKEPRAHA